MYPVSSKIEERLIIKQVEKICFSDHFKSKDLLCRFLSYIVSEHLAGRDQNLKGYTIGVEVFNRGHDFDPGQDALVRIHAGRLRRTLDLYYLKEGKNDEIRIEIPKGKYIPVFIPNTASQENLKNSTKPERNTDHKIIPTVTVFPFTNLSNDPDKDFFALSFSEEISVELTKFEDIVVLTNGVFFGSKLSVSDNRMFLEDRYVHFAIEGGIQIGDEQVKVLVKLTDVINQEQVWAERYLSDYTSKSLIDIQGDIAREVASVLGSEYGIIMHRLSMEANRIKSQNNDTYNAILKFHYFESTKSPKANLQAFTALEEALIKEPESGIATAMLARMYNNQYLLDIGDTEKAYVAMKELAEKAVRLDPNNLTIKTIVALVHFARNEKECFLIAVENCLKRNPNNSSRLGTLGLCLALYGEWERGKKILDKVMNSNIRYPLYFHGPTVLYHYRKKEYEEALTEAEKYNVPSLFWGPLLRACTLGQLNQIDEAKPNIAHLKKLKPDFEEKAKYLISRFVKEDELVHHVMEGLRKAGMNV